MATTLPCLTLILRAAAPYGPERPGDDDRLLVKVFDLHRMGPMPSLCRSRSSRITSSRRCSPTRRVRSNAA
jgi:hypothetical protein